MTTRRSLPTERESIVHKFSVNGFRGYVIAGLYEDGDVGELFVYAAKEGSTLQGLLDCWARTVSIALQGGIPLEKIIKTTVDLQFEPQGITENEEIRMARSIPDYIARWLQGRFTHGHS